MPVALLDPSEPWAGLDRPVARVPITDKDRASIDSVRTAFLEEVLGPVATFLPVSFLQQGYIRGRAVARIAVRAVGPQGPELLGYGSGFLIAPFLLMTNNHVLPDSDSARRSAAQFNYELDAAGNELALDEWAFAPERAFITSPFEALDFTIVGLAPKGTTEAGTVYGTIPIRGSRAKIMEGEDVDIIQHPSGNRKEVVIKENKVTTFFQGGFVQYTADTMPGSSGSPVFNDQWDVVALHHRGVIRRDANGTPVMQNGKYVVDANEGVRMSAMIEYLNGNTTPADQPALAVIKPFLYP